jgi:plastocyanin
MADADREESAADADKPLEGGRGAVSLSAAEGIAWRKREAVTLAAAFLASLLVTVSVGGHAQTTGRIEGHVTLTSRMRGVPIGTSAYAPRGVTAQAAPASPEIRSVVLYLKGVTYDGRLPAMHTQIRQEAESFSPRVVAITRGSTVDFPNFDPYFHNVFSLSGAATFDLGRYPEGQSRSRQFTRAGLVKVYCHIHSQMSASIVVLDHPYFATADQDGRFTIADVPAGDYTLVGWHERVGEYTSRVSVAAGQTTTTEVSLPLGDMR